MFALEIMHAATYWTKAIEGGDACFHQQIGIGDSAFPFRRKLEAQRLTFDLCHFYKVIYLRCCPVRLTSARTHQVCLGIGNTTALCDLFQGCGGCIQCLLIMSTYRNIAACHVRDNVKAFATANPCDIECCSLKDSMEVMNGEHFVRQLDHCRTSFMWLCTGMSGDTNNIHHISIRSLASIGQNPHIASRLKHQPHIDLLSNFT